MESNKIVWELIEKKFKGKGNVIDAMNYQDGIIDAIEYLKDKNQGKDMEESLQIWINKNESIG